MKRIFVALFIGILCLSTFSTLVSAQLHDVVISSVTVDPTTVVIGESAPVAYITVTNRGTSSEYYYITMYYDHDTGKVASTFSGGIGPNMNVGPMPLAWFPDSGVTPGTHEMGLHLTTDSGVVQDYPDVQAIVFVAPASYNATIAAHCNTEGTDVSVSIMMDGASTGYSTPHTFSGLSSSHTFTVPTTDASGHPFIQWSTGQTSTTITVSSGGTYTAYYQATPPTTYSATIVAHDNTGGTDVNVAITEDGSPAGYSTPHTFTGLSNSHGFTVPSMDANDNPFDDWSTGQTSTTITVSSNGTYTAFYQAAPYNVIINAHCNTEGIDVPVAITEDGSPTGFNSPHPFNGLLGIHTFAVPSTDASGHPFKQWSTGQTSTTITVSFSSSGAYTAYYQASPPTIYTVTINAHCNTENKDISVGIKEDGSSTGQNTPCTFSGLSGSHTFTVPNSDPSGHPFEQWSTSQTSTTITVSSSGTYTAYYQASTPPTPIVTINAHCNTEGSDVSVAIMEDGSSTGFTTPHSFGITGTHTFTVANTDPNGHPFKQWSTGETSTTITVSSAGTYTAYYQASSSPTLDFEISVSPNATTASPDEISSFTVTVTSLNGFNSPVMLTSVVDSAELTATFSSPTVTPPADGSTQSTMKVSVLSTQLKTHTILVYGISGAISHFMSVNLEVPFLSVPYYSQGDTGWCVPTSVAMIAKYYGISAHPWDVAVALNEPHNPLVGPGETPPISASFVLSYLSGVGLSGTEKAVDFNEIKALLDANEPVLIVLGPPVSHAFVITGYLYSGAGTDYYVFLNDPSGHMIEYLNSHGQSYSYSDPYVQDKVFWSDIDNAIGNHKYVSYVIGVQGNDYIPGSATGTLSLVGGGDAFSQLSTKTVSFKHPNSVSNGKYIVSDIYIWESGWLVSNDNSGDTQGLTWRRSPSHLLELDPSDNLSAPAGSFLIVNPADKSQTYYFELTFSKDGVQEWTSKRLSITVANCSHADYPLTSDLNMYADILKSEYGLYIIKLLLYTSPAGGVPIDEIDLPPISYVPLLNAHSLLTVTADCPVYVDLYDGRGNCVGYNATSGTVENQIDAAFWESNQTILVFNPSDTYRLVLTGTESGAFTLETSWQDISGATFIVQDFNGTITNSATQVFAFGASANVTLTNITSKTVVGQGFNLQVNATVSDIGGPNATCDVTLSANDTVIGTQIALNLSGWNSTTACFAWNTTGVAYGNYTVWGCAANGNCTGGNVIVTIPGDINGDFNVGLPDLVLLAQAYGSKPGSSSWNPNADINSNGIVDLADLVILTQHYGQHYP